MLKQALKFIYQIFFPKSYSQFGEDLIVINDFLWKGNKNYKSIFYCDIGAYHPNDGSNTYALYRRGARGICLDIGKQKKLLFRLTRPADQFLDCAVVPTEMQHNEWKVRKANSYGAKDDTVACGEIGETINVITSNELRGIVESNEKYQSSSYRFLTIDIEGLDELILPELLELNFDYVMLEVLGFPKGEEAIAELSNRNIFKLLYGKGYTFSSKSGPTFGFSKIP